MNTLVSVILPFYNSKIYLKDSIDSILNQTFKEFELLLMDDGSTDQPEEIIQLLNDSRVKYFKENKNKGIVYQLNKGISRSKGKYIARMDADDIADHERLQKQIDFLENPKNRKIDVVGSNAIKFGKEDGKLEFKNYKPNQISFLLNFSCPILHPTVMMRKIVFDRGHSYSESYKYAEDFALWKNIDNGRNIAILPDYLLKYRIHNNQTNQTNDRILQQMNSSEKIAKIKSVNYMDRIFLTENTLIKLVHFWFFNQGPNINFVQTIYIKWKKKKLGIKSGLLNKLIYK